MSKKNYKNFLFLRIILVALISIEGIFGTFHETDLIRQDINLGSFTEELSQYGSNHIIEFPDHLFAFLFNADDNYPYVIFIKDGVNLGKFGPLHTASGISHFVGGCVFTDTSFLAVFTFKDVAHTQFMRMVDVDGTFGPLVEVPTVTTTLGMCTKINSLQLGIVSSCSSVGSSWDIIYTRFTPSTNTLSDYTFVNTQQAGRQSYSYITKISNGNSIVTWNGEGDGFDKDGANNYSTLWIQELDQIGNPIGTNIMVETDSALIHLSKSPVVATSDGGFVISAFEGENDDLWIFKYNSKKEQTCRNKLVLLYGSVPRLSVYENYAYISFSSQDPATKDYSQGIEVDWSDCTINSGPFTISDLESRGEPSINVSTSKQNTVLTFLTPVKVDGVSYIYYSEYFLKQESACEDPTCYACFTSPPSCKVCSGSTPEQREIRERAENDCSCDDGYYDNQPNIDCGVCNYKCTTCKNGYSCLTCSNPQREQNNNCLCPQQFFDLVNDTQCYACETQCDTCENSKENCLKCQDTNKLVPGCNVCKEGFYLEISSNLCLLCPKGCMTCESEIKCISCSYFHSLVYGLCIQCRQGCSSCENTEECLSCLDINLNPPTCLNKSQFTTIDIDNSNMVIVKSCDTQCLTCENSSDNCLTCNNQENRESSPSCKCKIGFHDQDGTLKNCQKCQQGCDECSNSEKCLKCEKSFVFDESSGQCLCDQNSYQDENNGICIKCKNTEFSKNNKCNPCFFYQDSCVEFCPQNTDISGQQCEQQAQSVTSMVVLIILLVLFIVGLIVFFLKIKSRGNSLEYQKPQVLQNNDISKLQDLENVY